MPVNMQSELLKMRVRRQATLRTIRWIEVQWERRFEARLPEPGGRSARRGQTIPDREDARPIYRQRQDARRRSRRETSRRTRGASRDRHAPSPPPESRSFAPGTRSGAARRVREAGSELD